MAHPAQGNRPHPDGRDEKLTQNEFVDEKFLQDEFEDDTDAAKSRPAQGMPFWRKLSSFFVSDDPGSSTSKPVDLPLLLWRFYRVAAAFFLGDAKWKARGLMSLLLVFAFSATGMNVLISYNQKDITNALTEKKTAEFYDAIWKFAGICVFAAPFFALYEYLQGLMSLEWRVWLTDLLLSKYFAKRAFFDLKMAGILDNPDQRICEDVARFIDSSVGVILLLVEKLLSIFAFTAVLWSISPGIVAFLLVYAIGGTVISLHLFGRKMMWLQYEGLQREADMRYSLVRVRDNVESIAFYRGEHREAASVLNFLDRIVVNIRRRLLWDAGLDTFTYAYNFLTYMIPVVALAPSFFSGKIEYGDIVQTAYAFDQIFSAVTIVVSKFETWTGLAAETERLESLLSALKVYSGDNSLSAQIHTPGEDDPAPSQNHPSSSKAQPATTTNADLDAEDIELNEPGAPLVSLPLRSSREDSLDTVLSVERSEGPTIQRLVGPKLTVTDLQIKLPRTGEVLFPKGLSFELGENESLLVMGPSGCGKSSLLRAISGLWSCGVGSIECIQDKDSFFLPQKPYMTIGSLREQLLFPLTASSIGRTPDSELHRVLQDVHLLDVLRRFPQGLDETCDWSDTLSVGEQQRIAFARLLIRKSQMAFLDEATSALDSRNERSLYSLLQQQVSSYVSVGHRATLVQFHTHVLWFNEENSAWSVTPSAEFRRLQEASMLGPGF